MYKVLVTSRNDKWTVQFDSVQVVFEEEREAHAFVIELLKNTGRIGY